MLVEQDQSRRQSQPEAEPHGSDLDEVARGRRNNEHEQKTKEKLQELQELETQLRKNELLLHEAGAKHGDVDVAERLVGEGASLDCKDNNDARRTPLHKACATGTVGMVRFLALRGGSKVVNGEDSHGETPLHLVAGRDWVEMEGGEEGEEDGVMAAMELLRHGADTGRQDEMGRTALHEAAGAGNAKIGGYLMEAYADVDIGDFSGRRALHLCVAGGSVEMVHGLLRHGAVIDRRDGWGRTALHEACGRGWKEGVEALLCHGPDISLEDEDGLTGMQLARDRGFDDIVELLEDRIGKSASYDRVRPTTSQHEEPAPDTVIKDQGNIWAGVTREDGDGFLLASYNKHDISFAAKLESISPCVHEGKDMHEVQIKLNFMRPYSMDHRIRYAKVDAMLSAGSGAPNIRGIMPQADRVEVSEQEVSSGQKFTVGAAGGGGPSNLNISLEGSKNKTSTFKGVRIIHGAIQDKTHASWRLYEEPGSKSGLPEIVRLLLLVHCSADFKLQLGLSVTACHFLTFGIPRTLKAPAGLSYTVPKLGIIAAYEQESRLKQVLDVADRAAAVVEEAKRLQDMFSQAMRGHEKRGLIMEAGSKVNHFQEWTDILDDSRFSDFRALQGKLLEIDESPRRTRRIIERTSWDDSISEPRVERGASGRDYGRVRIERPYGGSRHRRDAYDDSYTYRPRRRRDYDDDEIYEGDPYTPRPSNAIHSFSAVGPGYHVSRLA